MPNVTVEFLTHLVHVGVVVVKKLIKCSRALAPLIAGRTGDKHHMTALGYGRMTQGPAGAQLETRREARRARGERVPYLLTRRVLYLLTWREKSTVRDAKTLIHIRIHKRLF